MRTTTTDQPKRRHRWWAEPPESSWTKLRPLALARWEQAVRTGDQIPSGDAEQAITFGHSARRAYREISDWSNDLERRLADDWKSAGHDTEQPWDRVKAAVRHGWDSPSSRN